MRRREFITKFFLLAGALKLVGFAGGRCSANNAHDPQGPRDKQSQAELAKAVEQCLTETENKLINYPNTARKLKDYLEALRKKTNPSCSCVWLDYQNNRLQQIDWLVDKHDDGRARGKRLRMRPYDIPWLVWGIGKTATPEQGDDFAKKMTNGVPENVDKVLNAPGVEIEFTDQFADFCCLCVKLDTEGCKAHKEFAGYGTTFPQAVQISPELRKDSDTILRILGLKWEDIVTGRRLLELCVNKAPDPAEFKTFPLAKNNWDYYRAGISRAKKAV